MNATVATATRGATHAAQPPITHYQAVRTSTEALCEPLATEDYVVQSMADISPTKWHLAHTTWFFETFVLAPHLPGYRQVDPAYAYLFNSYYVQAGARHARASRGYLSRPTVADIFGYRHRVDEAMDALLSRADDGLQETVHPLIETGLHHEQQHQELLLTDIKHVFSVNPLRPAYRGSTPGGNGALSQAQPLDPLRWISFPGGLEYIGHSGDHFAFDNESPRHRVWLEPHSLASRLVTNGEYLAFMNDGGYTRSELWLSLGWAQVETNNWRAPFYWEEHDGEWWMFTLRGMRRVELNEPVCHVNYFEADAFARWSGCRLPTEAEWESAATTVPVAGNFVERGSYHPETAETAEAATGALQQMYGDVWEWTQSSYSPYPGFRTAPGALGEYNGKFMCNQYVLRGGSCATPHSHIRPTYRNFFPPEASWQFSGIRLARNT